MIVLYNKVSGERIGEISEEQLQFLMDEMEEESLEDQDYSISGMELNMFEQEGADPALIRLLRGSLGDMNELVIEWREE